MRRFLTAICICRMCLTLISCSSNHSGDVYFLHAAMFSKDSDGNFEISAVLEKLSGGDEKNSYFTAVQSGKDIDEITDKLTCKYKECYFATCEYYFFDKSLSRNDLKDISKAICDSNDYPSKSFAFHVTGVDTKKLSDAIKSEDDMKKVLSLPNVNKVNIVHFLSGIYSGKDVKIPSLTVRNGKIEKGENKIYWDKDGKNES